MSVNQRHYVMIGMDLLPLTKEMNEDELDQFFEKLYSLEGDKMEFVYDGMNGEYCYFGYVLNKGNEEQGLLPNSQRFGVELFVIKEKVRTKLRGITDDKPKLISFTDWY